MDQRITIAIYFDLENINKQLDINDLLDTISLEIEEERQAVFAIKLACGDTNAIGNFRGQLRDNNFEIREAPHVSDRNIKNRADLILSMEAFETLVHNRPEIDLYVFITSDTDFTVVMDKLRKYGKQVWLATSGTTFSNKLFSNSSDKIVNLEKSFRSEPNEEGESESVRTSSQLKIKGFSKEHQQGIFRVLDSFEKDTWHAYSVFGSKIKNLYKNFSYKGTDYNSQKKLFVLLSNHNIIELRKIDNSDFFKIR